MSIVKVAEVAGVSHTTVSRVINNHPSVSPETIHRVREAMQQIGYTPPTRRRGPRRRSHPGIHLQNIGLLLIGKESAFTRGMSTSVLQGVEESLAAQQLKLMVGQYCPGDALPPLITEGVVDGLLIYGYLPEHAIPEELKRYPTVWLMSRAGAVEAFGDRVQPDNAGIGRVAAEYLLNQGHEHIAYMTTWSQHPMIRNRTETFELIAGPVAKSLSLFTAKTQYDLYPLDLSKDLDLIADLVEALVKQETRPTGLFLPSDTLVPQVYRELRKHGIEPGKDIEVMGCNNAAVLEGLDPRPVTLDLQPREIGRHAVRQLVWRLANTQDPARIEVKIAPKLLLQTQD